MIESGYKMHKNQGVYFLKDPHGIIKIGLARSLSTRIMQYKSSHSQPLSVVAVFFNNDYDRLVDLEREHHLRFDVFRVHGEWFDIPEKYHEKFTSKMTDDERMCCKMLSKMMTEGDGFLRDSVAASFYNEQKEITLAELAVKMSVELTS